VILVFDVGNTETTIGLFDGARLEAHWRTNTDASRTPDECAMMLDGLLRFRDVKRAAITGSAIGSVVPAVTGPLADAVRSSVKFAFGKEPVFVREGGSIGAVVTMEKLLKAPILFLGLSLPEHGYHAPNENYDWEQAEGGMIAFAKYFESVGALGKVGAKGYRPAAAKK